MSIFKGRATLETVKPEQLKAEPSKPQEPKPAMEWMQWMDARLGWNEDNHDKDLAAYWKYTNHHASTIRGSENAWCAMTVNAALHDTGYKGNGRADALSFKSYGTACELKRGCIVVIEHANGSHHVTFCDHIVDKDNFAGLGGNQSNAIRVSVYGKSTHDKIIATRWPVKAQEKAA